MIGKESGGRRQHVWVLHQDKGLPSVGLCNQVIGSGVQVVEDVVQPTGTVPALEKPSSHR